MSHALFRRTTFLVPNAAEAARFYVDVFGMNKWYDNQVAVHPSFPPAAPPWAPCHLILLKCDDPNIGLLGLMQYLDQPFDTGVRKGRTKVQMGETILIFETKDLDGVYKRTLDFGGASIVAPPTDWDVPTPDGKSKILLRTMSMFDPNGIYMEISQRR